MSHVLRNLRYPGVVPKALTMLAALFGAGHTMSGDFCAKEVGPPKMASKKCLLFFRGFRAFRIV